MGRIMRWFIPIGEVTFQHDFGIYLYPHARAHFVTLNEFSTILIP